MTNRTKQSFNNLLSSQWFWIACLILAWQLFALIFMQSFGSISFWPWLGKVIFVQNPGIRMPKIVSEGLVVLWAGIGIITFATARTQPRQKFLAATISCSVTLGILALLFREVYPTLLYVILLPVQNAKYTFSLYALHRTLVVLLITIGLIGSMLALKGKASTLRPLLYILILMMLGLAYTHYQFGIEDCSHLC